MKLEKLEMYATDVSDLSPLAGMPLKYLNIASNRGQLRDLRPLAGMPLERLNASSTGIADLSPLRGMPLREVNFHNYDRGTLPDFTPLAHSPTLEKICLPWEIGDLAFLTTLPKLQQVEFHNTTNEPERWMTVRDFLAMYGPDVPEIKVARTALAGVGVKDLRIWRVAVDPDHLVRLDLRATSLTDLTPLHGLPIKQLNLEQNGGVLDLEPLRGMPIIDLNLQKTRVRGLDPLRGMLIKKLNLSGSGVSDLEPLRHMPLVKLYLRGTPVCDVALLADLHDLEEIVLPDKATNVELLRTLPRLRYLSADNATDRPTQTAEEFWKAYDAQQAAGKK